MTRLKSTNHPTNNCFVSEVEIHYKTKIKISERQKVKNSRDAYEILFKAFDPYKIEHHEIFYCLYMNRANKVLAVMKISEGGISSTVVDIRIIFQAALVINATSLILSHNHPSGNLVPSESDNNLTKRLFEAGKLLEIQILDHLIVSPDGDGYYSYGDEGLL